MTGMKDHGGSARPLGGWYIVILISSVLFIGASIPASCLMEVRSAVGNYDYVSEDSRSAGKSQIAGMGGDALAASKLSFYLRYSGASAADRFTATLLLSSCGAAGVPGLVDALGDDDDDVRTVAVLGLIENPEEAAPYLLDAVDDPSGRVRIGAIRALGLVGGQEGRDALSRAAADRDPAVGSWAREALAIK